MMFAKALAWLEGKVFPAGLLLPFIIASSKFQNFPISFLLGKESLEVLLRKPALLLLDKHS